MPTKIYAFADAINPVFNATGLIRFVNNPNPDQFFPIASFVTFVQPGHWRFQANFPGVTNPFPGQQMLELSTSPTICTFEIDYTALLGIPADALIKKVTYRCPRDLNFVFGVNNAGSGRRRFNTGGSQFFNSYPNAIYPGLSTTLTEAYAGTLADIVRFDYGGIDANRITRAELIANFTTWFSSQNPSFESFQGASPTPAVFFGGNFEIGDGWNAIIEYDEAFSFQFQTSQANAPFEPLTPENGTVTVTSNPASTPDDPLDMNQILTADVVFPDPGNPGSFITINIPQINWIIHNPNWIDFILPSFGLFQPPTFTIVITSTQFSGSLPLQTVYTIWFTSASGIYALVPGKTNDTLYVEEDLPNTMDVKIPNPFGRTGFV